MRASAISKEDGRNRVEAQKAKEGETESAVANEGRGDNVAAKPIRAMYQEDVFETRGRGYWRRDFADSSRIVRGTPPIAFVV